MCRQLMCSAAALAIVTAGLGTAMAGPAHRQLGAHEHGHGVLNVAVEDDRVSLELSAPGADIVGFEHAARTDQQKAELAAAREKLKAGLTLFQLTPEAGCELVDSGIEYATEAHVAHSDSATGTSDHAHDHADGHDNHEDAGHDHDHAEFLVAYSIKCKAPAALTGIAFDYFAVFKNAQRLQVNVVTATGQAQLAATRDAPVVSFGDLN